jgi:hypothetical protein
MLDIVNKTPFDFSWNLFPNPEGVDCVYGLLKATFQFDGAVLTPAPQQPPARLADEYAGEPGASSITYAAEAGLSKPSTDVLMRGHAYPRQDNRQCDVTLRVGPVRKVIRVYGERTWQRGMLGGLSVSRPSPFEKMPLVWENAFGGTDDDPKDPQNIDFEPRNPIGRGLVPRRSKKGHGGAPLPNLEDPRHPIRGSSDHPAPACFAPVAPYWEPRKSFAGTYDQTWATQRAPFLPLNFDPRFLQCAPPDQIAPQYLKGGEEVEIDGATPAAALRFALPTCTIDMAFRMEGGAVHAPSPNLDTVLIEPDEGRLTMLWRASQIIQRKLLALREMTITCREFAAARGK